MSHYDVLLDVGYDYGQDGGHGWNTKLSETAGGVIPAAYQLWADWRGAWQLGNRIVAKDRLDYLRAFNATARGRAHSFLFRDWNDRTATSELLTVSGATTQLVRTYGVGGVNDYVRTIKKPEAGITITKDGAAYTSFTINTATGLITWTGSPPTGVIRWSGHFYVPVRFGQDNITAQFLAGDGEAAAAWSLGNVQIIEEFLP